jgi:hypothetical protein
LETGAGAEQFPDWAGATKSPNNARMDLATNLARKNGR